MFANDFVLFVVDDAAAFPTVADLTRDLAAAHEATVLVPNTMIAAR